MTGGAAGGGLSRLEVWFVTGSQHLYGEVVLELLTIDAATTVPAFKRDLRSNQAYYFIDRGL